MHELFRPNNDFRIQELTVEPPKREGFVFDATKEISKEEVDTIVERIERGFDQGSISDRTYPESAAAIAILFPEYTDRLAQAPVWTDISETVEAESNETRFSLLADMAVVNRPALTEWLEEHPSYSFDTEKLRNNMFRELDQHGLLMARAYQLSLIFPQRMAELGLDDEFFQHFNKTRNAHSTYYAARAKILFPHKAKDLAFTADDFEAAKARFDRSYKIGLGRDSLVRAVGLKILAARHAAITEHGLEIIDANEPTDQTPELPEQRRY